MKRPADNTTLLPKQLRQELGLKDPRPKHDKRSGPAARKERRREERSGKKGPAKPIHKKNMERYEEKDDGDLDDDVVDENGDGLGSDLDDSDEEVDVQPRKSEKTAEQKPKSNLKKRKAETDDEEDEDETPTAPKVPRTVQDKLDEDEAEIAALEKKLGMKKGKKRPKGFEEDGLDDLLGDLDDGSVDEDQKHRREADEWLKSKRRRAQGLHVAESEDDDDEDEGDLGSDEGNDLLDKDDGSMDGDMLQGEDGAEGSEFDGFGENEEKPEPKKENPFVAPVPAPKENQPAKYIPPSLRGSSNSESESLTRLRRQAQGQLNKLSEANLVSILAEFEKLYRDNPRQHVTSTVISLLMGLICERSALQDTFMILHAGFIAAVYKVVGMDFGAELLQKIVQSLDAQGDERGKYKGKELLNLISLLSQLYNFHVIGHALVFDYIRIFLQDITEENTELLLKVIRNSGPQLRQDDPSSLKDIVLLIQPTIANIGEQSLSVRTKFMIDTITDLKNNKVKSGIGSSVTSEHIAKMRKILGSLNSSRVIRASEPINISREDIHNSAKKGKWWLVGASWREDPLETARKELSGLPSDKSQAAQDEDSEGEPDLTSIAKSHRMNTDVRRSIFVAIMSATDFQDAHVRLLKLRLKRAQEYEIPRVLTHCVMEEEAYNPYYTLIARRICGDLGRRIKVSFTYTLWNIFKRMGEKGDLEEDDGGADEDENEDAQLPLKSIVNLAKMYASLIVDNTLTLAVLKILNFAYLQPKAKTFVELLIISIIQQSQQQQQKKTKSKSKKSKNEGENGDRDEKVLMDIFVRAQETPQIVKGLIYFIRKVVAKTDIVPSVKEVKDVKWGCKVAVDSLKVVSSKDAMVD